MIRLTSAAVIALLLLPLHAQAHNACTSDQLFQKVLTEIREESSWLQTLARAPTRERQELLDFISELNQHPWKTPEQEIYRHLASYRVANPSLDLSNVVIPTRTIHETVLWFRGEIQELNPELVQRIDQLLSERQIRYGTYIDLILECNQHFETRAIAEAQRTGVAITLPENSDAAIRSSLLNPRTPYLIEVPTHRRLGHRDWSVGADPIQFVSRPTLADGILYSPKGHSAHDQRNHTLNRSRRLVNSFASGDITPVMAVREHRLIAEQIDVLSQSNPDASILLEYILFSENHEAYNFNPRPLWYRTFERYEFGQLDRARGGLNATPISDATLETRISAYLVTIHISPTEQTRLNTQENRRAVQRFVRSLRQFPHPTYRSRFRPATSAH